MRSNRTVFHFCFTVHVDTDSIASGSCCTNSCSVLDKFTTVSYVHCNNSVRRIKRVTSTAYFNRTAVERQRSTALNSHRLSDFTFVFAISQRHITAGNDHIIAECITVKVERHILVDSDYIRIIGIQRNGLFCGCFPKQGVQIARFNEIRRNCLAVIQSSLTSCNWRYADIHRGGQRRATRLRSQGYVCTIDTGHRVRSGISNRYNNLSVHQCSACHTRTVSGITFRIS